MINCICFGEASYSNILHEQKKTNKKSAYSQVKHKGELDYKSWEGAEGGRETE